MWSRLHNREETPFASSAEDLFAFSLCPSLFCVFSSPSPPAFSKYHQTPSCHLVAHPVGTWIVIAPVAEAIAVLEQLTDHDELFWAPCMKRKTVPYGAVVQSTLFLKTFRDHVNRMAATGAVPIAAIPEVDGAPWPLNSLQFRRTLAWHIANQPFGIVAGKIQYQHVSVTTFEGYAGQSESGFRSEIEAERQLQQMEDIVDRYEDYCRGVKATGPGAAHIGGVFAQVQQEWGDFPGRIVDRGR